MTRTIRLQLSVDGDPDPLELDSRNVPEGDHVTAYDLANICLETAARLITWQSYKDRFDGIVEQIGDVA